MSTQEKETMCSVWCRQSAPIAIIVVLGTVVSLAVFLAARSWEQKTIRHEFDSLAEDRFHAIHNVFDESAKLLHFTDNVFMVAPQADSPQFTDYVRSLKGFFGKDLSRYPELHALIWAPRVPRVQQAAYVKTARAVFDPNFQISEPKDSAGAAASQRSESFPAYLCIAATPDHDRPGEDLSLDSKVWSVMERARDSGDALAAPPTKMSTDANDRFGYRVFQPLYHGGDPGDTASRRKNLAGFLCLDLDVGKMVAKAFKDLSPVGIDVLVYDDVDANRVTICRHTSRLDLFAHGSEQRLSNELETSYATEFFGRKLTLRSVTTPSFWVGRTIWQPWLLLCGGLALTLVGAGYRLSHALHTATIEQAVATRIAAFCQDVDQRHARSRPGPDSLSPEAAQDELHKSAVGAPTRS